MANNLEYIAEYQKANNRRVTLYLNRKNERHSEIIAYLEQQPSMQGYIIDTLYEDIKRRTSEEADV